MLHVLVLLPSPFSRRLSSQGASLLNLGLPALRGPIPLPFTLYPLEPLPHRIPGALDPFPFPYPHTYHTIAPHASNAPKPDRADQHQQTHYCNLFIPIIPCPQFPSTLAWPQPSIAVITSWLYRTPGPILHSLTCLS